MKHAHNQLILAVEMAFLLMIVLILSLMFSTKIGRSGAEATLIHADLYGDPLPSGSLVRLGTTRLHSQALVYRVGFLRAGKTIVSGSVDGQIRCWDAATGTTLQILPGRFFTIPSDFDSVAVSDEQGTIRFHPSDANQPTTILRPASTARASFALSPNRELACWETPDHAIRLWSVAQNREIRQLIGHRGDLNDLVFSPDGRLLASGGAEKTICLWEVVTGKKLYDMEVSTIGPARFPQDGQINSLAFSPDGKFLASGSNENLIRLWNVSTGKERMRLHGHEHYVSAVAFSPDGTLLASGSLDQTVRLWDVRGGKQLREVEKRKYNVPDNRVTTVAFSPDGRVLAASGQDRWIRLWDVAIGKERPHLPAHDLAVHALAYSPDGHRVATWSEDRTVRMWEAATGKQLHVWQVGEEAENPVPVLAFSLDGKAVQAAGPRNTIRWWDVLSGKELFALERTPEDRGGFALAPDGKTLATEEQGEIIRLWDLPTKRPRLQFRTRPEGAGTRFGDIGVAPCLLRFSPDSKTLALSGVSQGIQLRDVATGKELRRLGDQKIMSIQSLDFSPNGSLLATGLGDLGLR